MGVCNDPVNLSDTPLWSECSLYLKTFGITSVCSGYFLVIWLKKKKDTKYKIRIQLTRHLRCLISIMLCPQLSNTSCWKDSLIWRDLGCPVHPRGSGLLATVGWSWAEASAPRVPAALAGGALGSEEVWAGVIWEPLAAKTHIQQVLNIQQCVQDAQPHLDPSRPRDASSLGAVTLTR